MCQFRHFPTHSVLLALSPHIYLSILAEQDRNDVLRQRIIFKENLKKIGGYIIWSLSFKLWKDSFNSIHFMEAENGNFPALKK